MNKKWRVDVFEEGYERNMYFFDTFDEVLDFAKSQKDNEYHKEHFILKHVEGDDYELADRDDLHHYMEMMIWLDYGFVF